MLPNAKRRLVDAKSQEWQWLHDGTIPCASASMAGELCGPRNGGHGALYDYVQHLAMKMMGLADPLDRDGLTNTTHGHVIEDYIFNGFNAFYGGKAIPGRLWVMQETPWKVAATPDAEIEELATLGEFKGPLHCLYKLSETVNGVPHGYVLQAALQTHAVPWAKKCVWAAVCLATGEVRTRTIIKPPNFDKWLIPKMNAVMDMAVQWARDGIPPPAALNRHVEWLDMHPPVTILAGPPGLEEALRSAVMPFKDEIKQKTRERVEAELNKGTE